MASRPVAPICMGLALKSSFFLLRHAMGLEVRVYPLVFFVGMSELDQLRLKLYPPIFSLVGMISVHSRQPSPLITVTWYSNSNQSHPREKERLDGAEVGRWGFSVV